MPLTRADRLAIRQLRPAFKSSRLVDLFLKITMLAVTRPHALMSIERSVGALLAGEEVAPRPRLAWATLDGTEQRRRAS